jgi:hypothetical protein
MTSIVRRLCFVAAVVGLTACANASDTGYAPVSSGPAESAGAAGPRYSVRDFSYHVMPLRKQRSARQSAGIIYPADLTNYGGPMLKRVVAHNIYVNCPAKNQSCWGAPEGFQTKLTGSAFAGMLEQYTGSAASSITFGEGTAVAYSVFPGSPLYENDLLQIVHQVAAQMKKTGYGNLYHIFLPKGTDTCFDFSRSCYSPDRPGAFGFCAYHAAARFSDIGTVIYSVEPYQNVSGCLTVKSAGASKLTNSTISTLAHETFESITDPGPKLAWINYQYGELADECEYFVSKVTLQGTAYNTQPMYSNRVHGCTTH